MRVTQGRREGAQSCGEEPALVRDGNAMLKTEEDSCRRRWCKVNMRCGMLRIFRVFISLLLTNQLFFIT